MNKLKATLVAGLVMTCAAANAHDFTKGDLMVIHPRIFATPPTAQTGGGYLAISNDGAEADRLLEVRAEFPKVMIHQTAESDGIATMSHVEGLEIPAGETVLMEPGGYHVMFMGLGGDPFEVGEEVPATLVFEKAGEMEIIFHVVERE